MIRKIATGLCVLAAVLGLQACNTIEGLGKDISKMGDKLEEAARKGK
jgi:predicted small secreted protein